MSRRIAISGATGLVGTALCRALADRGDTVLTLTRSLDRTDDEVFWDWTEGRLETDKLEGIDGFVHLAGRPIADRWSGKVLRDVEQSRSRGTRLIADGLAGLTQRPGVLISASAIGFYGDGRERRFDDTSPRGDGWMADVCAAWEAAAKPAADAGIRVAIPRIGIVLNPAGGALAKMLPPFKFGVGGRLGDGKQGMSWIALADLVRAILHLLDRDDLAGPFVATAPSPVSNDEFTRTLARVLRRPAFLPVPAFAVSALFGEMGRRLLLDGDFIRPTRLLESGFEFRWPELEPALRHELGC